MARKPKKPTRTRRNPKHSDSRHKKKYSTSIWDSLLSMPWYLQALVAGAAGGLIIMLPSLLPMNFFIRSLFSCLMLAALLAAPVALVLFSETIDDPVLAYGAGSLTTFIMLLVDNVGRLLITLLGWANNLSGWGRDVRSMTRGVDGLNMLFNDNQFMGDVMGEVMRTMGLAQQTLSEAFLLIVLVMMIFFAIISLIFGGAAGIVAYQFASPKPSKSKRGKTTTRRRDPFDDDDYFF